MNKNVLILVGVAALAGLESSSYCDDATSVTQASSRDAEAGSFCVSGFQSIDPFSCEYETIMVCKYGWLAAISPEFVGGNRCPFESFFVSHECDGQSSEVLARGRVSRFTLGKSVGIEKVGGIHVELNCSLVHSFDKTVHASLG